MNITAQITQGFLSMAVLIIAIGAQNIFVLKQGLLKQHVFSVALICCLVDITLSSLGIFGVGELINQAPLAQFYLALAGSLFLFVYGYRAAKSAFYGNTSLHISQNNTQQSLGKVVLLTLAVTLLNPHVYLDTVVILGGLTVHLQSHEKWLFFMGAMAASFSWFFGIGYGARLLLPLFKKKVTWRLLDSLVAFTMWAIAISLLANYWHIMM